MMMTHELTCTILTHDALPLAAIRQKGAFRWARTV
jgi:hypothetical protein